jgi:uncharacterized protein YqjF (DUF2071 family)
MSHPALNETAHRPWPVPKGNWVMEQSWHDLLFAHWSFPVEALRGAVPDVLPIDTYEGRAWVGVVPFQLRGLRARMLPAFPGISNFPELNLRTYVTLDGKPGVYFFSLDAGNKLAVMAARTVFHLNYYEALMAVTRAPNGINYLSRRTDPRGKPADFSARYRAAGKGFRPQTGTLEHFLAERYCLYAVSPSQRVYRLEIHHKPWLLQPAEAQLDAVQLFTAAGLTPPTSQPLLHFSPVQEMIGWLPDRVK